MKTHSKLWKQMCSYSNLDRAFRKTRRRKTKKDYVKGFEKDLKNNLDQLRVELLFHTYKPKPLKTFVIRDPKTRKISKSDFRDRIVHHALCNVIEPIFDRTFIYDSYANRKGKGTSAAIERFDQFKRKICNTKKQFGYVLKADLKHYFQEINHEILLKIVKQKIRDRKMLWLIKQILANKSFAGGAIEKRITFGQPDFPIFCKCISQRIRSICEAPFKSQMLHPLCR